MDSLPLRPDCRRFVCDLCDRAAYICSWCDRGHRYCSDRCRRRARRQSQRKANRRYQQSHRGRRLHAGYQAVYRQKLSAKKVTDHSCRIAARSASVESCETHVAKTPRSSSSRCAASLRSGSGRGAAEPIACCVCGHLCEPLVRGDFLRCRRPRGATTPLQGAGDDIPATGGRDPPPVHRRGLA